MKLELNELLQGICSWKDLLKQKDEENETIQKQLSQALKRNEILENTCTSLFSEVSQLNNAVSLLRNSLLKIESYEVDRKMLLEEKQRLKNSLNSLEKLHHVQYKDAKQELEKVKLINKEETESLISQISSEANKKVQNLQKELAEKESHIKELKDIITKLQVDKDEDLLKIKIQYEEKIGKLKQQIPKSKMQTSHMGQTHDIFRQKYITLKKESEDKIAKLNEQVKAFEILIESLKSRSTTSSLSSVLLTSNKQNTNALQAISKPIKRSAMSEQLEIELSFHDGDDDFSVKESRNGSMHLQKRRLFNLNQNYYAK